MSSGVLITSGRHILMNAILAKMKDGSLTIAPDLPEFGQIDRHQKFPVEIAGRRKRPQDMNRRERRAYAKTKID